MLKTPSFREQLRDVGSEGGNGKNNTLGPPAAGRCARCQLARQRQFISANIDRLRIIKSLLAHGADVNGTQH